MSARRFAVIDAETDPFKFGRIPVPFLWGYFDGDNYEQFTDTRALIDFIKDQDAIIYAHNGGKFDFHFLLDDLEPFSDLMIINGRIAKVKLGEAELRDSWNILPVPLAAYKKTDIDYAIMEVDQRHKPENWRQITAYLKDDCVDLYEIVARFHEEYGVCLTQAGASMRQWKKVAPLDPPRTDADYYHQFAPYYFGGRVQCFEKGIIDADFSVYDINSAYPFAMLSTHPYSANFSRTVGYQKGADFYHVLCISDGIFPVRLAGRGLSFPNDGERREYHVTKWEYLAGCETGALHDVEILESITFCSHVDFAPYINKFYELRNEAKAKNDLAGSLLYKLAMNSLYGKFAANPENYKCYQAWPMEYAGQMSDSGWSFSGELGPWALASAPINENAQHFYNVATGASITGFVRAMLWRAMKQCDRVLYCDTDSIACVSADLTTGDKLGEWKHEGDFDRAGIGGKKLYIFQGIKDKDGKRQNKMACKGVRLTERQMWQVARGKTVRYKSMSPSFSVRQMPSFITREINLTI